MQSLTDKELVEHFLANAGVSFGAFNEIVRRYEPLIFSFCLKYFRNRELAEEISQEALLKIYANVHRLSDPKMLKSWAMRLVSNLCTDHYRKIKRRRELQEKVDRELERPVQNPQNETSQVERLHLALEKLKSEERDIIMLHYFSDLTVKEISAQLEIGESAVKMRLSRCREKLLGYMSKQVTESP